MAFADIAIMTAAFWFAAYAAIVLAVFGLPSSLSETHYLWCGKMPKAGKWVFPLSMLTFVALLLPSVLTKTESNPNFQFVAFLMLASLGCVAVFPWFKSAGCGSKTHFVSAYLSAAFGLFYCIVYGDWRFPAMFGVLAIGAIIRDKARYVLYMEMVAFLGIICCLLI